MVNEVEILENKLLRDKLIDRVEVLEKVKELLLLPNTEYATIKQVADYYEVEINAIKKIVNRHKDELLLDGLQVLKGNKLTEFVSDIKSLANNVISLKTRSLTIFPRRAILRVGMLLRDSEIAKEVRTQLLNIEEKTIKEQKIESIDEEQKLVLAVYFAKTDEERLLALSKLKEYKDRYIQNLEDEIDALAKGNVKWDVRSVTNKLVRKLAIQVYNGNYKLAWGKIYDQMLYKHHINVNTRLKNKDKHANIFSVLSEDELKLLVKTCVSICKLNHVDITEILNNNNIKDVG